MIAPAGNRLGEPPRIPWILRLPPTPGIILAVLFGGASTFLAWQTYGFSGLHGIWITAAVMVSYYFLQDYFRLRAVVSSLRFTATPSEIVHYQSGHNPHEADYNFAPDADTKPAITKEKCAVTITSGVIKVVRPEPTGRYYTTISHYSTGRTIPVRNVIDRRIRVAFQYKTSGPPYRMSVRLRSSKHSWEKRRDGRNCVESLILRETEWADSPPVSLEPAHPEREFLVGFELDKGASEPGSDHYLLLRNIRIWEDA